MEQVIKKVLKKPPYLILLSGMNAKKPCLVGIFSSQALSSVNDIFYETQCTVPRAQDCFIFYYEEDFTMHFEIPSDTGQHFAVLNFNYNEEGAFSIMINNNERVYISFQSGQQSYVDINLQEISPIEKELTDANLPSDIPVEFVLKAVEYWVFTPIATLAGEKTKQPCDVQALNSYLVLDLQTNLLFDQQFVSSSNVLNYFRTLPIYNLPASITVRQML